MTQGFGSRVHSLSMFPVWELRVVVGCVLCLLALGFETGVSFFFCAFCLCKGPMSRV